LTLLREGKKITVVSGRAKRSSFYPNKPGYKTTSGLIVPNHTTQAEVDRMVVFDGKRIVARVFPTHYPSKPELFYAGFEIFVLRDPEQLTVGGIEDRPASRAGVHWGEVLKSVNGVPVTGMTPAELEQIFAVAVPVQMRLEIDRLGEAKTFEFQLEKASEIARLNEHRLVDGRPVPIWATGKDVQCFLQ
jgi:hypothetical protein